MTSPESSGRWLLDIVRWCCRQRNCITLAFKYEPFLPKELNRIEMVLAVGLGQSASQEDEQ